MTLKYKMPLLITMVLCLTGACANRTVILTPKPKELKPFEKDVKDWIQSLKKPYVSMNAVDLLVNAGWRATLFLVDALQDKDRRVRGYSARALGKIGTRLMAFQKPWLKQFKDIVVPALVKSLMDKEAWVRNLVVEALGRIGTAGAAAGIALRGLFKRKVVPCLTKLLKDKKPYVRKQAAKALKRIGSD